MGGAGTAGRQLTSSQEEWLRVRRHLREDRPRLSALAARRYARLAKVADTTLLTSPAWLPDRPIPLQSVEIGWVPDAPRARLLRSGALTQQLRPVKPDGARYPSYSAAMADLAAPSVFRNRTTFRLRSAGLHGRPRMDFEPGRYFDGIDVGEACAHELAAYDLGLIPETPLRDAIGDPCDLAARPVNLAVAALTLRHTPSCGASFPLHWRDPAKVGHAGGLCMVVPVGIFQAGSDDPARQEQDLSLWRSLVREYAEELAGEPERDHVDEAFGRRMEAALRAGKVEARVHGIGVDPLTFATDVLAEVGFDAAVYDDLFGAGPAVNAEGRVDGLLPFDRPTVERLLAEVPMQAAGAALLRLASRPG